MAGKLSPHAVDQLAQLGLGGCTLGRRHHMRAVGAGALGAVERDGKQRST
jgi:hypothetical protein